MNTAKLDIKRITFGILLAVLMSSQTACTGFASGLLGSLTKSAVSTTLQSGPVSAPGQETPSPVNGATDEGGSDDDSSSGDSNVLPQASIPLPPGLESVSVSMPDGNGDSVVQGNIGADNASYGLVINAGSLSAQLRRSFVSPFKKALHAVVPEALASDNCPTDISYDACVTVNADGSFETTIADMSDSTTLSFYFYDPDSEELSEASTDTPNANLVHLAQSTVSVTADGDGNLYGMSSSGDVVKLSYDATDARMEVQGDNDDNYLAAALGEDADKLAYNATEETFLINKGGEVHEYEIDEGAAEFNRTGVDSSLICAEAGGCASNQMKVADDEVFFSGIYDPAASSGIVYELTDNTTNRVEYSASSLGYSFLETKAFDVTSELTLTSKRSAIAVGELDDGSLRLFGKHNHSSSVYTTYHEALDSAYTDVYDLEILEEQEDDDSNDGRGIFLSNVGLTFFDYDIVSVFVDGQSYTLGPDIEISNAVAMTVSSDKSTAYIISSGSTSNDDDDYITVVDLTNETLKTDVGDNGVIALSDYFDGKTISDFSAETVTFFTQDSTDYLMVGLNNADDAVKNSALVIELE